MYLNDSKIKHILAIFFVIGIANELSVFLNVSIPILSLIYLIGLILVILNFNKLNKDKYIWEPGLGIIGILALSYLFFYIIDYEVNTFKRISSIICLLVWFKCIKYLNEDKDKEDQEDPEINEEDENIGKI